MNHSEILHRGRQLYCRTLCKISERFVNSESSNGQMRFCNIWVNSWTPGNTRVHNQHCGYYCPGAKAPGRQYPQCWLKVHCIGLISYEILHVWWTTSENKIIFWKTWPSGSRVKRRFWIDWIYCYRMLVPSVCFYFPMALHHFKSLRLEPKMADILQKTFSNVFPWVKNFSFE